MIISIRSAANFVRGAVPLFLAALTLLVGGIGQARADIVELQVNASADRGQQGYGYATTTGDNYQEGGNYGPLDTTQISNVYLSNDNGLTFLNSGDGPSTSIDLPTSTVGTFAYQFYFIDSWAHALTLQLWTSPPDASDPSIVVSTQHDADPGSFLPTFDPSTAPPFVFPTLAPLPVGSDQTTIGDYTITLTAFSFTNGSGPASAFSVSPDASITPEIYGSFTYQVNSVPEPSTTIAMLGLGITGLLGFAWRRRAN